MTAARAHRHDEPDDEVPPLPPQQVPRLTDHDVPDLPEHATPSVSEDETVAPQDPPDRIQRT